MWLVLAVAGAVAVASGLLPFGAARDVALTRGGPVLAFLVGITVLAQLADQAGVFDAAAGLCARAGRGSTRRLWLLLAALGTLTTIGMSLDTTAVLLTPVVLTIADRLGLRPLPFALLPVWLANTGSLLLPVSNLTNLLALQTANISTVHFALRMALPEAVAVIVTVTYLSILFRRDLGGSYKVPVPVAPPDIWTFRVVAVACVALVPGVVAGVAPWEVATPCAGAAAVVVALRRRDALQWSLIPWRIVILVEGLFLVVATIVRHGLGHVLHASIGASTLRTVAVAGVAANAVNNLPAYLALEPSVPAGHTTQLLGVLLGTDGGPLILLWGSLATLLWNERCRAGGLNIRPGLFAAIGAGGVPLVLLGTWAALIATS
jgi:arsenical pump membrane protein